jgi:hypothetical protein
VVGRRQSPRHSGQTRCGSELALGRPAPVRLSTTVPARRTLIESSQMYVATSAAGESWTAPQEIALPFAYSVGKRHMVVQLLDGSFAMPISWDLWAQRGTPAQTEGQMDFASGVLIEKRHGPARLRSAAYHGSKGYSFFHGRRMRAGVGGTAQWRVVYVAAHWHELSV